MRLTIWNFVRHQFERIPEVSTFAVDLTGKVVIVTGANVGLGYETAKHLATMNPAKLILACRDSQKGDKAAQEIRTATGCSTVESWKLDISDPESVKAFVDRFDQEGGGKLDILVENAGINTLPLKRAVTGWDLTIATNHFGTVHLAIRMLPYLLKAEKPRLVIVASEVHYWVSDPEEADTEGVLQKLNEEGRKGKFYAPMNRYFVSKLFNVLFVRELASRLPPNTHLTVNSVNPGMCVSSLARDAPAILVASTRILARTTEVGSRMFVHAAVARDLEGKSGVFLDRCQIEEPSDFVISERGASAANRLWNDTLAMLSEKDPKLPEIVKQYLN